MEISSKSRYLELKGPVVQWQNDRFACGRREFDSPRVQKFSIINTYFNFGKRKILCRRKYNHQNLVHRNPKKRNIAIRLGNFGHRNKSKLPNRQRFVCFGLLEKKTF